VGYNERAEPARGSDTKGIRQPRFRQPSGVRTENCPPGFKTGDQISPPGGYVGGGQQLETDIAIDPPGTSGS